MFRNTTRGAREARIYYYRQEPHWISRDVHKWKVFFCPKIIRKKMNNVARWRPEELLINWRRFVQPSWRWMVSWICGLSSRAAPVEAVVSQSATDWSGSSVLWIMELVLNKPGGYLLTHPLSQNYGTFEGLWFKNTSNDHCWFTKRSLI